MPPESGGQAADAPFSSSHEFGKRNLENQTGLSTYFLEFVDTANAHMGYGWEIPNRKTVTSSLLCDSTAKKSRTGWTCFINCVSQGQASGHWLKRTATDAKVPSECQPEDLGLVSTSRPVMFSCENSSKESFSLYVAWVINYPQITFLCTLPAVCSPSLAESMLPQELETESCKQLHRCKTPAWSQPAWQERGGTAESGSFVTLVNSRDDEAVVAWRESTWTHPTRVAERSFTKLPSDCIPSCSACGDH